MQVQNSGSATLSEQTSFFTLVVRALLTEEHKEKHPDEKASLSS